MSMTLKVPSIKCQGCVDTITKEIKVHDDNAKVTGDVEKKTIEVDSSMSEESVKESITVSGHEVA